MKALTTLLLSSVSLSDVNGNGVVSAFHASLPKRSFGSAGTKTTESYAEAKPGSGSRANVALQASLTSPSTISTANAGVLDQALGFLTGSSLVYLYAEMRQLSYAGFTETEFKDIDCNEGAIVTAQTVMATFLRERYWSVAVDNIDSLEPGEEFRDDKYVLDNIKNDLLDSMLFGAELLKGTPREDTGNNLEKQIDRLAERVNSAARVSPTPKVKPEDADVVAEAEKAAGKLFKWLLERDAATDEFPDNGNKKLIALIKEFSNVYLVPGSMLNSAFVDDVELVHFSDRYPLKECVWGITINRTQKQITVVFRGSVNANDWAKDFQMVQDNVENPVKGHEFNEIGVHFGFHAFLKRKRMNGKYLDKFEEIMSWIEKAYKRAGADDDWKIAITGHSLGAALSSLFGFYAAADGRFNKNGKPIQVFSFASPYVGDNRYRAAFKHLEKTGKLIHARFCNKHDVVTYEPSFSPDIDFSKIFRIFEWDISFYHHVGLQVQLMLEDDKPALVSYPFKDNIVADLQRGLNYFLPLSLRYIFQFGEFHSAGEYQRRILEERKRVETDTLNVPLQEYYKRAGIAEEGS